jgi:hypothetical protein
MRRGGRADGSGCSRQIRGGVCSILMERTAVARKPKWNWTLTYPLQDLEREKRRAAAGPFLPCSIWAERRGRDAGVGVDFTPAETCATSGDLEEPRRQRLLFARQLPQPVVTGAPRSSTPRPLSGGARVPSSLTSAGGSGWEWRLGMEAEWRTNEASGENPSGIGRLCLEPRVHKERLRKRAVLAVSSCRLHTWLGPIVMHSFAESWWRKNYHNGWLRWKAGVNRLHPTVDEGLPLSGALVGRVV